MNSKYFLGSVTLKTGSFIHSEIIRLVEAENIVDAQDKIEGFAEQYLLNLKEKRPKDFKKTVIAVAYAQAAI